MVPILVMMTLHFPQAMPLLSMKMSLDTSEAVLSPRRLRLQLRDTFHRQKVSHIVTSNGCISPIFRRGWMEKQRSMGGSGWISGFLLLDMPSSHVITRGAGRQVGSRWDKRPTETTALSSNVKARLGRRREENEEQRRYGSISRRDSNNNGNVRRKLGGRCSKCFGEHSAQDCTCHPEDLRCRYTLCAKKVGHVTMVCQELTKTCNLPICGGALGHRSLRHDTLDSDGKSYGYTEEAAECLRDDFYRFEHLLTDKDWQELSGRPRSKGGQYNQGEGMDKAARRDNTREGQ